MIIEFIAYQLAIFFVESIYIIFNGIEWLLRAFVGSIGYYPGMALGAFVLYLYSIVVSFVLIAPVAMLLKEKYKFQFPFFPATLYSSLCTAMFLTPVLFLYLLTVNTCHTELQYAHVLNQHVKDLCYFREDTSECPRDESELKALNPSKYRKLGYCADTEFVYDETIENIRLFVRPKTKQSYNHSIDIPSFTRLEAEKIIQPVD